MSKQENRHPRLEMLRRRVIVGMAVLLMGASFIFTWRTSAHNINLAKANEVARTYAGWVRAESGGKYIHSTVKCVNAFPNHNHFVRCLIQYQNAADKAAGVYTCKESIELFLWFHTKNGLDYRVFGRHTSYAACGNRKIAEKIPIG